MPNTKIQTVLDNLATRNKRILQLALHTWMLFAQRRIQQDLAAKFKKDITSELTDWRFIESQGQKTLKPATLKIMQSGGNQAYKQLAVTGSFDVLNVNAIKAADKFCAKLIKDVTVNTKQGVRTYISAGVKAGKSMPKIARELRPLVGLTKLQTESVINFRRILEERRPDFSVAQIDRKVMTYTNKTHRRRMENIARTETARAQNIGYAQGLEEVGVVEAEFRVAPTDACDECLALDKTRYPVAEAAELIPVHPRCRCAILPVVGEKAIDETLMSAPLELPGAMASEEGLEPWKRYLSTHTGEKSSNALLYDWYKLRYETTGKITGGTKKFLRAKAPKFEATSIRITKPISGLEDIIKPLKIPPGPKPVDIPVPKPAVPKPLTQKEWEASLTVEETKAINYFTADYYTYADIRNYQLGKGVPIHVQKIGKLFDDVLARAPKYEGTVYRGSGLRGHPDINVYKKGGTVKFDVSTSSSKLKSVADEFMGYADDVGDIPVRFTIRTKTGVDISKNSLYKSQMEVALSKGSKFRVVKEPEWIINTSYKKGGYYRVHLEEIVVKPKPPGLLPKSYFNEVDKWDERLVAHKASLRECLGFDIEALKMQRTDLPEYKAALVKFEKALKSYTKPKEDFNWARKRVRPEGVYARFEPKAKRSINKFYDRLEEIAGDDFIKSYGGRGVTSYIYEDHTRALSYGKYRANARIRQFTVNMSQSDNVSVYFHELGHLIEDTRVAKTKAYAWVRTRGAKKRMKYSDISYSKDREWAYKDKFIDPYVGKFYGDGSTEVMSMGMQQFTSYKQMMRFAKKDFDHFAFIHGILTGAI